MSGVGDHVNLPAAAGAANSLPEQPQTLPAGLSGGIRARDSSSVAFLDIRKVLPDHMADDYMRIFDGSGAGCRNGHMQIGQLLQPSSVASSHGDSPAANPGSILDGIQDSSATPGMADPHDDIF